MQDVMQPINTPDKLFQDGNPNTGALGTIVTATWLNAVQGGVQSIQAELVSLLASLGINPDAGKNTQVLDAVRRIAWGGAARPTTLAGYGITDAQPASPDLAALAGLKGAAGLYVNTGPGAATVRSLAAGQGIAISNGDGKAGNPTVALANSGAAAGTYGMVTVDAMGRVTAGRQMSGDDVPAHDWSKIASGKPTTLAGYGITDAVPSRSPRFTDRITVPEGSRTSPGIAFDGDGNGDTGFFHPGDGSVGVTCNGVEVARFTPSGPTLTTPSIAGRAEFENGSVSEPTISFVADRGTGIYHPLSGLISIACNGVEVAKFTPTGAEFFMTPLVPTARPGTRNMQAASTDYVMTALALYALGMGQSTVDVTSNRTPDARYVNSTGRAIEICVSAISDAGSWVMVTLAVDGVTKSVQKMPGVAGYNAVASTSGIVPPGAYYSVSVTGTGRIYQWSELR
ncbi:hypothetical protein [Chromobacterium phragmitis]|uniref:Phage tail protein n=1 Tax=Chromobacterium phragmitis TaxID=2202141 RepID=A0A344UCY3_9NEIS|nr:hypothetical protein [Chromobacterium phragmitis]AXE33131.1 hypothetical protein DK843_01660 [Chromobacterium phragmitis]